MLPPRTRLDPDGYYYRLGVEPAATQAEVVAAFRSKARLLHPDVPTTGNAGAFVAVKQAYDVLSNRERRAAYDRKARAAAEAALRPDVVILRRTGDLRTGDPRAGDPRAGDPRTGNPRTADPRTGDPGTGDPRTGDSWSINPRPTNPRSGDRRTVDPIAGFPPPRTRSFSVPLLLWIGLGAFLCLSLYQAVTHLLSPRPTPRDDIGPNAAVVLPLSPSAHLAMLYGAAPVRLAGTSNFYVVPAPNPTVLWRLDTEHNTLVPLGQLPPFSTLQAIRLVRQNGLLEVMVNDHTNGFVSADRLTPGDEAAARRAYCGYNAGQTPHDGELLERHGSGNGRLEMENRAVQPTVVKLRDETGAVVMSVFLGPGGHAVLDGIPDGTYHTEFAIGELWSRACNSFAAGMRARRIEVALRLPGDSHLVVAPDGGDPPAVDIPDQAFERN